MKVSTVIVGLLLNYDNGIHAHFETELTFPPWLAVFLDPCPSAYRLVHFQLSWRHLGLRRAVAEVWRAAVGNSVIFSRADNAAFDMTVQSAHRWNQVGAIGNDGCYYCTVV